MAYDMTPVIASRQMMRTHPDGVKVQITVEIGTPAPDNAHPGDWYCPLRFVGVPLPQIYAFFGNDSALAITGALSGAGKLLRALPFAGEIDFSILPTFGFPDMPSRPARPNVLSGTVTLENCNDPAQNITFEFRPLPSGDPVVLKQVLTPTGTNTGSFRLEGIPDGTYDIAVKGFCWLRKVIHNVVVNGSDISGLSVSLLGGDIDNDNVVDINDLTKFISHYNTAGEP